MNDRLKNISAYERGVWEHPLPVILRYTRLAGFSTDFLRRRLICLPHTAITTNSQRKPTATTTRVH